MLPDTGIPRFSKNIENFVVYDDINFSGGTFNYKSHDDVFIIKELKRSTRFPKTTAICVNRARFSFSESCNADINHDAIIILKSRITRVPSLNSTKSPEVQVG